MNIDPRHIATDDPHIDVRRGDATRLPFDDHTVEQVFSNAMFEHLFFAQHDATLREWARVLTPTGTITTIGIPDFAAVCELYLARAEGVTGPTFDLFEAYRYTIGFPEGHLWEQGYTWDQWDTTLRPDCAPSGYVPQIHKALFDADYLYALLEHAGLKGQVFRYAYIGEAHTLNLGFVAGHTYQPVDTLNALPFIGQYINADTLDPVYARRPSRMALITERLEHGMGEGVPPGQRG